LLEVTQKGANGVFLGMDVVRLLSLCV
jgi:hypothetical protein